MPRYTILESVGSRVERVNSFEDLEKHHPSSGRERGRDYATINGELEEVRYQSGRTYIKKDFILQQDTPGPVSIPAPASGYIHHLNDGTNAVRIYDKPFGTPGAVMLAQSLHMQRGSSPREGSYVEYGAPMGRMGDVGSPGSVHAHVEAEHATFQRYIRDIANGTIRPGGVTNPLADGVLRNGESGTPVQQMQQQLKNLGYRDAQGRVLVPDGDFGDRTQQALQSFQRAHGLNANGIADGTTLDTLRRAQTPQTPQTPSPVEPGTRPQPTPQPPATPPTNPQAQWGPTPLSNLIGSGEGGYGSYNRGRAGDAGGRQIDFSQMTIGEIMRRQALPRSNGESLFAVGKFQIIPDTMRETVQRMGIDRNARFTPELQERMFADYLVDEKRPAVRAYITGAGGAEALGRAQLALAQEFASVADPRTGRSYYDGDSAGNSASISPRQVQTALDAMRERYRANVAEGMTPAQAYAAIGGGAPAQSTPRPPAMADGVLRQGESGDEVRQLQQRLRDLGFKDAQGRALVADGDFGSRTHQAVQAFQRANDLSPSGVADRITLETLRRVQAPSQPEPRPAAPERPAPPAPRGAELMRLGDDGSDVRDMQQRLVAHRATDARGNPIAVDGEFGSRTREAVLSFQRSHGLEPDGVVGRDTLAALRQAPPVRLGDTGDRVSEVQRLLNRAGIEIPVTGRFSHLTEGAVKDYQQAHGLKVDGVVGPDTLERLQRDGVRRADAQPTLSDARHPDHALYAQTLTEVRKLDAQRGRGSDAASEQLAGALTVEAKRQGMTGVDHVVLSEDGSRAFAVQGRPDDVLRQIAYVETQAATQQPLAESARLAAALPQASRTPARSEAIAHAEPDVAMHGRSV